MGTRSLLGIGIAGLVFGAACNTIVETPAADPGPAPSTTPAPTTTPTSPPPTDAGLDVVVDASNDATPKDASDDGGDIGGGQEIVYGTPEGHIRKMKPDGTGIVDLTPTFPIDNTSLATEPRWSLDRTRIAFSHTYTGAGNFVITVMNADGTNLFEVFNGGDTPGWSPDGQSILFKKRANGGGDLGIARAPATPNATPTTITPDGYLGPRGSPDDTKILVFGNSNNGAAYPLGVFVLPNVVGAQATLLVNPAKGDWGATWSPDGTRIAFHRKSIGGSQIFVANADGTNVTPVTSGESIDFLPTWSPNGQKLAFSRRINNRYEIFTVDVAGTNLKQITTAGGHTAHWGGL